MVLSVNPIGPKILIESMHGIGDLVCILPLIREVREHFSNAYITVLINNSSLVDILDCSNIRIDKILSINAHIDLIKFITNCFHLRKEKYDIAISSSCTSPLKAKLVMSIINAREKFGYQFDHKDYGCLYSNYHFVDANNLVLHQMGLNNHNFRPRLYAKESDIKTLSIKRRKHVVGVCIGRADPSFKNKFFRKNIVYAKGWGNFNLHVYNMSLLIKMIMDYDCDVVLIGAKREVEILRALSKEILLSEKCHNFVDKTSISESIALIKQCDVVVGVDTGMQHVADAVGVKTVSIFGPTNPRTQGAYSDLGVFVEYDTPCKYCYGTYNYINCKDRKCLSNISVDVVFNRIKEQLEN